MHLSAIHRRVFVIFSKISSRDTGANLTLVKSS
nr:MAG TPA: hypothetical protein [Caudoviricetes sp.]DAR32290.1 MAG TPA: hypothetical protein [Caudoviricetes sp.]DAZ37769.1 MAG TPA: hypothetical protein [Caudoviricetes sp.]